jgi:hypothetical protein
MSTPIRWPGLALAAALSLPPFASVSADPLPPDTPPSDKACQPIDHGIELVIGYAKQSGSKLVVVPHGEMQAFIAGLGDKGKGIVGDSALVLLGPQRQVVLFVKHGDAICIEAASDDHPDTASPLPAPDAM